MRGAELNLHENNDLRMTTPQKAKDCFRVQQREIPRPLKCLGTMPVWAGRLSRDRMIHLGSPRNVPAEKVRQGLSRVRFLVPRNLLRRALGYDAAAILAAFGT